MSLRRHGRLVTAVALVCVVVLMALLRSVLPVAPVSIVGATVGGALLLVMMRDERARGAVALAGEELDPYPLQVPADRVAVGRLLQFRLLPPTRRVWAPGLLCVRPAEARFFPSKPGHASRAWEGPISEAEVHALPHGSSVVRLRGDAGAAQFVLYRPAAEVVVALGALAPVKPT